MCRSMNKQKLSIIIPMYNGANTIRACLDSIFYQYGSNEYEIIIVNDGSTDLGAKIVSGYQISHPNLILINQPNSGVSVARNRGIEEAGGEYITFVDCDDIVGVSYSDVRKCMATKKCLHAKSGVMNVSVLKTSQIPNAIPNLERQYFTRMLASADKFTADVAFAGKFTINYQEYALKQHSYDKEQAFYANQSEKHKILIDANNRENANFALYRKSFLDKHNLRFLANMPLDEDMLFCILSVIYADCVVTVPESTYLYLRNENSASCFAEHARATKAYAYANLQRFPIILKELEKYPQYAKSYKWFLNEFASQGMKIDIHKNIELASLYYDYPSTICAGCDADTCKKCLYFPVVKEKINTAIKKYAPIKASR